MTNATPSGGRGPATGLPPAADVATNPDQDELRKWAAEMPAAQRTVYDNIAVETEIVARLSGSTFFVSDTEIGKPRMGRSDYQEMASRQDAHIGEAEMVLIEGYIGPDPDFRTPSRLYIERSQANIPAMQQQLYFPPDDQWGQKGPVFTVIYTPTLEAPGYPDDKLIAVDLDNWTTRVFGSDYFGESKMGGLRMWNRLVFDRGGLALHSGAKVFPDIDGTEKLALIIGLSGTGKTTTTFSHQLGSLPVQDDFCALLPGGGIRASEDGCFAKTFGLSAEDEPAIHDALTRPDAWLENVAVDADGSVDFFDGSHTKNGRGTFSLGVIEHRDPCELPNVDFVLILNRSFDVVPAVCRLTGGQAAAYFMLGETTGTSAGGKAEAGKALRVPGTNPFFFTHEAEQGNRFLELLETIPDLAVYVMNTGRVGGQDEGRSKKVEIPASSAIVEGIASRSINWAPDPDFGYEVATEVAGVDAELLRPRRLYERQGRLEEYEDRVAELKEDRRAFLRSHEGLRPEIVEGLG